MCADDPVKWAERNLVWMSLWAWPGWHRRRVGQGLSCGPTPGECQLLKGSRSGSGCGGFGQHLYSKLWGSVGLLECGGTFGLEPHTQVTFIRTGKRNRLPWMIYGRACILGMWYCNLCYRIRTSVSREVCSLTMSLSHEGFFAPSNSYMFYLGCLLA